MVRPNQNYTFKPTVKLYQSSAEQGGSLFIGGSGFTPNGTADLLVKKFRQVSVIVLSYPTDRNGTFLETYRIDPDMQVGTYLVWGQDRATGVATNTRSFRIVAASPFTMSFEGAHWRWTFHSQTFYLEHYVEIQSLITFADRAYEQYAQDLGFGVGRMTIEVTHENDNMSHLYVGSASGDGIAFTADLVSNDYQAHSFISHEMANIFQGNVTGSWPWADGRGFWLQLSKAGQMASPFPYMASAKVLQELGYGNYSARKVAKDRGDCGGALLWAILSRFGWAPFRDLFSYMRRHHVDLVNYNEAGRNAVIMVLMSAGTGYDYIRLFNETFSMRGFGLPESKIQSTYALFQDLPPITDLTDTGIVVSNGPTPARQD
jgi:hypothetical protein